MEIYDVKAKNSKFFRQSVDQSFPQVACKIHRQTGAILFAVERDGRMQLNPGKNFKIDGDDILFYICLTHEDDAAFTDDSLLDQGKDMQILQNGESKDTEVSPGKSIEINFFTKIKSKILRKNELPVKYFLISRNWWPRLAISPIFTIDHESHN